MLGLRLMPPTNKVVRGGVGCYEAMSLLRDRPTHDGLFRPLSPAEAELAPFILRERDRRLGHLHTLCNAYCMAR